MLHGFCPPAEKGEAAEPLAGCSLGLANQWQLKQPASPPASKHAAPRHGMRVCMAVGLPSLASYAATPPSYV
jgi:hypothetical protein